MDKETKEEFRKVHKRLDDHDKRFDKVDDHLVKVDKRLDKIDDHLAIVDKRLDSMGSEIMTLRQDIDKRFEAQDRKLDTILTAVDKTMATYSVFQAERAAIDAGMQRLNARQDLLEKRIEAIENQNNK